MDTRRKSQQIVALLQNRRFRNRVRVCEGEAGGIPVHLLAGVGCSSEEGRKAQPTKHIISLGLKPQPTQPMPRAGRRGALQQITGNHHCSSKAHTCTSREKSRVHWAKATHTECKAQG